MVSLSHKILVCIYVYEVDYVPGCFCATDKTWFKVSTLRCSLLEGLLSSNFRDLENGSKASLYLSRTNRQDPKRYCAWRVVKKKYKG